MNVFILCLKCSKTHLQVSLSFQNFPGVIPPELRHKGGTEGGGRGQSKKVRGQNLPGK